MTLTDWLWLAFAIFGPLPLVWVWKWWRAWSSARNVRDTMAYRRAKFGGFVSTPGMDEKGQRRVVSVDRPD